MKMQEKTPHLYVTKVYIFIEHSHTRNQAAVEVLKRDKQNRALQPHLEKLKQKKCKLAIQTVQV